MNKYTGISIGPIVKTLSLARKPRELWSASFLFSHLMSCIIKSLPNNVEVISPAKLNSEQNEVGLYPDRLFIKGDLTIDGILSDAFDKFNKDTGLHLTTIENYFNIMLITIDANSHHEAVKLLNQQLDVIELNNRLVSSEAFNEVTKLIKNVSTSPLFKIAFGENKFPIGTLGEIATHQLKIANKDDWERAKNCGQLKEERNDQLPAKYKIFEEDSFYQELKNTFRKEYKSYHKYICIIQADGDNMGKIVSNVADADLQDLSNSLLKFGKSACQKIKLFGGLPIYAGGDDLLFISPVRSADNKTIFDLIAEIDEIGKSYPH